MCVSCVCFFFKQKTAYEMRISDWSSDVCSSDLAGNRLSHGAGLVEALKGVATEDRAAFGEAISLHQRGPGHRLEPLLDLQRQGRAAGNAQAQRGKEIGRAHV